MPVVARLRGILGTGLVWGVTWAVVASILSPLLYAVIDWPDGILQLMAQSLFSGLLWGGVAGALFASALMLAEQRYTLPELSRVRVAAWGAVAGAWPLILAAADTFANVPKPSLGMLWLSFLGVASLSGAASGLVMLRVAKRDLPADALPTPSPHAAIAP